MDSFIFWDITPCSPLKVNGFLEKISPAYLGLKVLLAACFLTYSSTLKMQVLRSTEMPVEFQLTTWRYIPEDRTLHKHGCQNFKSCIK
jgi:hypothetical protein